MKSLKEYISTTVAELPTQQDKFEALIVCDSRDEFETATNAVAKKFSPEEVSLDEQILQIKVTAPGASHKKFARYIHSILEEAGLSLSEGWFPQKNKPEKPAIDVAKLADVQQKQQQVLLDPAMDKEVFIKSLDIDGKRVVFKKIGLGFNKPIQVFIDGSRWEVFPSLKVATKEAKNFLKNATDEQKDSEVQTPIVDDWDGVQDAAANILNAPQSAPVAGLSLKEPLSDGKKNDPINLGVAKKKKEEEEPDGETDNK